MIINFVIIDFLWRAIQSKAIILFAALKVSFDLPSPLALTQAITVEPQYYSLVNEIVTAVPESLANYDLTGTLNSKSVLLF